MSNILMVIDLPWCNDCRRYFVSRSALEQHLDYSPAHRPVYHCEPCSKDFSSAQGLEQHQSKSIKHLRRVWNYVCEPCRLGYNRLEGLEDHKEKIHHWCKLHDRFFGNDNNLRQHKASKAHGEPRQCPGCTRTFPTITAVTLHLESGTCASGMNRRKVDQRVYEVDTRGVVTNRKLIGYGEWEPEPDIWATACAWNGWAYECYFCDNEYNTLERLNGHITQFHAPKRTENIYNCPACGRQFKLFSQLIGHVEQSETCTVKEDRRLKGSLLEDLPRACSSCLPFLFSENPGSFS